MKKTIFLFGIIIFFGGRMAAQIEGEVTDEQNKAVLNVVITATDSAGKVVASVKPDKRGFYGIDSLHPGKYKIEAKAAGFIPFSKSVVVTTAPEGSDEGSDTYFAILVDIIMVRPKNNK